jgi:predicted outer membrane repeat protein
VVTRLADSGPGTLRQAIEAANNQPGLNHIRFHPHLHGKVIKLNAPLPAIEDSMTIQGPGSKPNTIIIDGQGNGNVFRVLHTADNVALRNLTVRRGLDENGGGLHNEGLNTVLAGVKFKNNQATNGGAIFNYSGDLTIRRSAIVGNQASKFGGGIQNLGGLTVKGTKLIGNQAGEDGGAINNLASTVDILFSTIAGNRAAGLGGGMRNHQGAVAVFSSTFSGNTADSGGAIYNRSGSFGSLALTNTTLAYNTALANQGGGGLAHVSGDAILLNCTVAGNVDLSGNANSAGGVTRLGGTLHMANTAIVQNLHKSPQNNNGLADLVNGEFNLNNFIGEPPGTLVLGPLQNNGGPTLTMAPLRGSPVIDAGSNTALEDATFIDFDQRGKLRILDGNRDGVATVDIGAVEAPRR